MDYPCLPPRFPSYLHAAATASLLNIDLKRPLRALERPYQAYLPAPTLCSSYSGLLLTAPACPSPPTSPSPNPEPQPSLLPQHPLWLSPSVTWPLPPSTTIVPGARSDLFRMPRGVRPLRESPARLQEPPIPGRRVRKEGGSLAAWTKSSFWKCPRWWLLSAHRAWAGGSSDPGTCSPRPTDLSPGSRVWSCTWSR